jgi:hypothetical protein
MAPASSAQPLGRRLALDAKPKAEKHVSIAVITGSSGLIGSEAAIYFGRLGLDVVGIDNDMRRDGLELRARAGNAR